jgi:hypothetical protein
MPGSWLNRRSVILVTIKYAKPNGTYVNDVANKGKHHLEPYVGIHLLQADFPVEVEVLCVTLHKDLGFSKCSDGR